MLHPLVSIIVLTYNSDQFILDTLNSIKHQTYKNIELIIGDDGSKDNTIQIISHWISKHQSEINVKLITVEKNSGISTNLKRSIELSNGEWIKLLAGDDLLKENSIEYYVQQLVHYPSVKVYFSKLIMLHNGEISAYNHLEKERGQLFNLNAKGKYEYYLLNPIFLNTPSVFIKKSLFEDYTLINESFKLLEDQPLFYALFKNNVPVAYLEHATVIYRIHGQSITNLISIAFYENLYNAFELYRKKDLTKISPSFTKLLNRQFKILTTYKRTSLIARFLLRIIRNPINKQREQLMSKVINENQENRI